MTLTVTFMRGQEVDSLITLTFSDQWGNNPYKAALEHAIRFELNVVEMFETQD